MGAVAVGAVMLTTGVAVSASTAAPAAAAQPSKKTTTTTTTTTVPSSTTTTQPCTGPASATATGVNTTVNPPTTATMTMTPGSCILNGTVVSLSGSGFVHSTLGTFLECNSDANQPTVNYLGNAIPISCTGPFSPLGPGIVPTTKTGTVGPSSFHVAEGATGPPCAPSSCTGLAATDSSGGSPFTDAAKYPCPPTAAQLALKDTCGILYGDQSGDAVVVPIAFNPNVAPPPVVTPTSSAAPTPTTVAGKTAAKSAKKVATRASSGSLAFTGTGPGLWWLALLGIVLMVLGLGALALVEQPRRLFRAALSRVSRPGHRGT